MTVGSIDRAVDPVDRTELPSRDPIEASENTDDAHKNICDAEDLVERPVDADAADGPTRRVRVLRVIAFVILPIIAMILAGAAGYFRYVGQAATGATSARIEATVAARDGVTAMFSYTPDNVGQSLNSARDRLTGGFKDEFTTLINDVAIPGAKQNKVSTRVTIPSTAVVEAEPTRVVVVLFVNQSSATGDQPPTDTAFTARTTLEKVDGRWLIASFDPI